MAMWAEEVLTIILLKTERGLGFSILDYQDPINPNNTVIVIRNVHKITQIFFVVLGIIIPKLDELDN